MDSPTNYLVGYVKERGYTKKIKSQREPISDLVNFLQFQDQGISFHKSNGKDEYE
jgi:hypothetical protein